MRTIHRDIVSALIFSKDRKIFQGMIRKGGAYPDCWHIPGGGIDDGENKDEALIREIEEETGIDISSYDIELVDDIGQGKSEKVLKDTGEKVLVEMNFYVYKVIIKDKIADDIKIELKSDLVEYQWVNLKDLNKIKLTPPSVELFKRMNYI